MSMSSTSSSSQLGFEMCRINERIAALQRRRDLRSRFISEFGVDVVQDVVCGLAVAVRGKVVMASCCERRDDLAEPRVYAQDDQLFDNENADNISANIAILATFTYKPFDGRSECRAVAGFQSFDESWLHAQDFRCGVIAQKSQLAIKRCKHVVKSVDVDQDKSPLASISSSNERAFDPVRFVITRWRPAGVSW